MCELYSHGFEKVLSELRYCLVYIVIIIKSCVLRVFLILKYYERTVNISRSKRFKKNSQYVILSINNKAVKIIMLKDCRGYKMGFRFYIGGSGSGKSHRLYTEIIERSIKDVKTNYLIIVPDQFTMQTQKDLVLMHPNKGIMNIDVLSFGRLSYRVFDEVGGNETPVLDDTGKSLVLRKVAQNHKNELKVIQNNLKKIGYIHEVKSAISEFMQYGISPSEMDQLIEFAKNRNSLKYKLEDLSILYKGFLEYTKDRFITTEESTILLKQILCQSKLIKNSVIVLDGFTGFTPVQNSLIQELMVQAKEVIVTILLDGHEDPNETGKEQQLFYLSKKTMASITKLGNEARIEQIKSSSICEESVFRYKNNPMMAHLERQLFRYPIKQYVSKDNSIHITEAISQNDEIREVCIKIHELIRTQNYRYQDIAVVTGDLTSYAHHVEREFPKYQIPYFLDQTNGLFMNPFINCIKSAIDVIVERYSYDSMFQLLRCGMIQIPIAQIDEMDNYVIACGIRGKKKWTSLWTRRIKGMPEDCTESLSILNQNRETIVSFLEPFENCRKNAKAITETLYQYIVTLQLQEKLELYVKSFTNDGNLAKAKEYSQVYKQVMVLLDQIVDLLGDEEMNVKEYAQILYAGIDEIQIGTIPQNADQVVVGDIERTRLKQIKALFFVGINDGAIPKSSGTGGIISDIDREFLAKSDFELAPSPRQQIYIQRLYLYMNMTKPTNELFLSYAVVNGEGKALRPSYLVKSITSLFPGIMIRKTKETNLVEKLTTSKDGLGYLVMMMRNYAQNSKSSDLEYFATLFDWYQNNPEYKNTITLIQNAGFFEYTDSALNQKIAKDLYGTFLENSVSRLEKFAACAYEHFLQYGLYLEEKNEYSFERSDLGTVFHGALELFFEKLGKSNYTWFNFPKEFGEHLINESVESYATQYGETILYATARNEYMVTRIKRILKRTILGLQYQLQKGVFQPSHFEILFSTIKEFQDSTGHNSCSMRLNGRIDRIDTYEDENNLYVKIIDYKTGNKDFDLEEFYYGIQLQLMTYMNAAMESEQKSHENKQIIPAALLYYHITDPCIQTDGLEMDEELLNEKIMKELRTKGVVNADRDIVMLLDTQLTGKSDVIPVELKQSGEYAAASKVMSKEQLQLISDYTELKIKKLAVGIMSGNINIHPFDNGKLCACTFCNFQSVCKFDKRLPGFCSNEPKKLPEEFLLEKMQEELGEEHKNGL